MAHWWYVCCRNTTLSDTHSLLRFFLPFQAAKPIQQRLGFCLWALKEQCTKDKMWWRARATSLHTQTCWRTHGWIDMYTYWWITVLHLAIHVCIQHSLVASLTGGVQCQTQTISVGQTVEAMEMELVVPAVHNVPTESTGRVNIYSVTFYMHTQHNNRTQHAVHLA